MKTTKILVSQIIVLAIIIVANFCIAQPMPYKQTSFCHPGMMQNHSDIAYLKKMVHESHQPYLEAYNRLIATVAKPMSVAPVRHISQGAYGSEDMGGKALLASAERAYDCALLSVISGDKTYSNQAIQILNGWSYTLEDFDGNNAKLLAGLSGHFLLNAAELLRYYPSDWQKKDVSQFEYLMLAVYYPLIKDFFPEANGNWDASMINTMLDIGIFCNRKDIFNRAVSRFYLGVGNGGITKYIYPGGQPQEATRDWGHVQLGLGEFAKAAQVAWTQGIDFYSVADNRLAFGFEYTSKFLTGENVPVYGNISLVDRSTLRDIYESVYQHYQCIKHIDMPYTLRMIERTRKNIGLAFLSSSRSVAQTYDGKLVKLPSPGIAVLRVGAKAGSMGINIDSNIVIKVKSDESIQNAINKAAKFQGIVLLLSGIHRVDTAILLQSGVSLRGEGLSSILISGLHINGPMITTKEDGLRQVTISNLVLEGETDPIQGKDPNDARRMRSFQKAPSKAGILLRCKSNMEMKDIHLTNLTIRHFTMSGVMIADAHHIVIDSCDINDNGTGVSPGPGMHHNLYLLHTTDANILYNRLDYSPFGSGLEMNSVSYAKILGNETARNHKNGITCRYTTNIQVTGNLSEGNDGNGFSFGKCRSLKKSRNLSRCNRVGSR